MDCRDLSQYQLRELFQLVRALETPCAVAVFRGSDYDNHPRRVLRVSVIVACESLLNDDRETLTELIDQAVALLDRQTLNQALFVIDEDRPVDIGQGLADFEVRDH